MCGIAGCLGRERADEQVVRRQLDTMLHRGPDSVGVYSRSGGAVGQTRLAVQDPEHGDPPLTDESGRIGVALNGEIYNFLHLREQLLRDGHAVRTRCDTEVLAHLAEALEPAELCRRLLGMFAFAIWDDRRQQLVLGRDRLGKKPLYYWSSPDAFVFGSEIKGLLAHPAVPSTLDPSAVPAYLTFGYVPTPRTFFDGVRSVPPGCLLVVDADLQVRVERYWEPPLTRRSEAAAPRPSLVAAATDVRRVLTEAVERRLIADVPVGAFLSGGIDSSAVVGVMAGLRDEPVRTFTIGFDDAEGYDERPYAALVARRFRTEHTEFVVRPDAVDLVERLVWHHDQPFGDSSAVPTYLLSELAGRSVTVALCGDGGDELFAGYQRFAAGVGMSVYDRLPAAVRRAGQLAVGQLPPGALGGRVGSAQRLLGRSGLPQPDGYRGWISYVPDEWRSRLLARPDGGAPDDWALEDYRRTWQRSAGARPLDRLLDLNLRTYLLDDLLPKVDRMSMAHGLEVRAPLLDTDLLELATSLPPNHKLRGWDFKRVLKLACADLLPPEVVHRPKRGFGVPLDRWFRGELEPFLVAQLGGRDARVRQHLAPAAVDALLAEHASGARHGSALWTLLTLEVFLRRQGW